MDYGRMKSVSEGFLGYLWWTFDAMTNQVNLFLLIKIIKYFKTFVVFDVNSCHFIFCFSLSLRRIHVFSNFVSDCYWCELTSLKMMCLNATRLSYTCHVINCLKIVMQKNVCSTLSAIFFIDLRSLIISSMCFIISNNK